MYYETLVAGLSDLLQALKYQPGRSALLNADSCCHVRYACVYWNCAFVLSYGVSFLTNGL